STFLFVPSLRSSSRQRAHVQLSHSSECFFGIEEDGDRTFIDELHGHHSLKDSGRDEDAEAAKSFAIFFVKLLGQLRWGRGDEAGPPLAARVAVQRELRDDERGAFDLKKREVHFMLRVFKEAKVSGFFSERSSYGAGVLFANA